MPNTILARDGQIGLILARLTALGFTQAEVRLFRDTFMRSDKVLTDKGEIQSKANVTGRTEPLSSTLQNVTSAGELSNADHVAADGSSFVRVNSTQRTGGDRAAVALDSNNRLSSSIHNTAANVSNVPTAATGMTNDGTFTTVNIAGFTQQFPFGQLSYNSTSYDPGSFNTWFFYITDALFAGGAQPFIGALTPVDQASAEGRIPLGVITTVGGSAKTGGGYTGGTTTGGGGGRGINLI